MNIITKIGSGIVVKSIWQQGENSWMLVVEVDGTAQIGFGDISKGPEDAIARHNETVKYIGKLWAEGVDIGQKVVE